MKNKYLLILLLLSFSVQNAFAQAQPASQPTALSFLGVKAYGMSLSFTLSDASHYLIMRSGSPITGSPVDGTDYAVGDRIGNAKILAIGSNSFYTFREAVANTEYYFAVYAFNDGTSPNYLTSSPLSGSVITKGKEMGNYYSNYRIDTEDALDDLTDLLFNHIHLDYNNYDETVTENIFQKDTTNGDHYVQCEYSNQISVYSGTFSWTGTDYNREHVTPKAWMPSDPSGNSPREASDYFNLFSTYGPVNQQRSDDPFGEVASAIGNQYFDSQYGDDNNGLNVFEPKQSSKGNVARTLFYQLVTYNGKSGSWAFNNLQTFGDDQDVDLLVQWHLQDPVDNFEIARNEYIYSQQDNRNPFVDFPEWVSCIDFKTLTLNGTCPTDTADVSGIISFDKANEVSVCPNPIEDKGFVKLNEEEKIQKLELLDLKGSLVDLNYKLNGSIADLNLEQNTKGFYFLKIYTDKSIYTKKINKL